MYYEKVLFLAMYIVPEHPKSVDAKSDLLSLKLALLLVIVEPDNTCDLCLC